QRGKQERTKPAFHRICSCIRLTLQQVNEETLNDVLCISRAIPASPRESVKRRPVVTAKLRQRGICRFIFAGTRCDHAPVSSCKCGAAVLDCPRNPFHKERIPKNRCEWQDCWIAVAAAASPAMPVALQPTRLPLQSRDIGSQ